MPASPSVTMPAMKDEKKNCAHCNCTLEKYTIHKGHAVCLSCYMDKFASRCETCNKPISYDDKSFNQKERHWHAECFKCWSCQGLMTSLTFFAREKGIYCSMCYENMFAERCDNCNEPFKHGMQKFELNEKIYHNQCFICSICKKPIGYNNFMPRDSEWVCMPCYNENFAQKCGKCNDILSEGGVTYKNSAYHSSCFVCINCDTELGRTRFATRKGEDDPYCEDCYNKKFSPVCEKCNRHILGFGTAVKYIALDGKSWHADCFVCANCSKTLLYPAGFMEINGSYVCRDCGKSM